jgi:hypothetical protein
LVLEGGANAGVANNQCEGKFMDAPLKTNSRMHPNGRVAILSVLVGLVLAGIGARFLFWPVAAARTFGIHGDALALHHVIALRDIWLGLMAVGLAVLKEWRALSLWMALGALVCLGDSVIAARAGGRWPPILFHLGSGVVLTALAIVIAHRRKPKGKSEA